MPTSLLCVLYSRLVPGLVAVTAAPGTTAWFASRTTPRMTPVPVCASAGVEISKIQTNHVRDTHTPILAWSSHTVAYSSHAPSRSARILDT